MSAAMSSRPRMMSRLTCLARRRASPMILHVSRLARMPRRSCRFLKLAGAILSAITPSPRTVFSSWARPVPGSVWMLPVSSFYPFLV